MTTLVHLVAALPVAGPITPEAAQPALEGVAAVVVTAVAAVLVLLGAVWVLLSAIAMHRVGDALSRVNALGPATGVGIPWIVIGAWLHNLTVHAFSWIDVVKVAITLGAIALHYLMYWTILATHPYEKSTRSD